MTLRPPNVEIEWNDHGSGEGDQSISLGFAFRLNLPFQRVRQERPPTSYLSFRLFASSRYHSKQAGGQGWQRDDTLGCSKFCPTFTVTLHPWKKNPCAPSKRNADPLPLIPLPPSQSQPLPLLFPLLLLLLLFFLTPPGLFKAGSASLPPPCLTVSTPHPEGKQSFRGGPAFFFCHPGWGQTRVRGDTNPRLFFGRVGAREPRQSANSPHEPGDQRLSIRPTTLF